MDSIDKSDENISPNLDNKEEKKMKSALSWSLILNSGDSNNAGTSNKRRKRSMSRCKSGTQSNSSIYSNSVINSSYQSNSSSLLNSSICSKVNKENLLKKKRDFKQNFQINRIFFEEFPVYRKEYQYPSKYLSMDTQNEGPSNFNENYIRGSLKLIPRRSNMESEHISNPFLAFFENKKICLLGDEEYLFHSKRQLLLKLRWYGAKTLDYYSSRADYVICSSTFNEVMAKLKDLSIIKDKGNSNMLQKLQIDKDIKEVQFENLRGVRIGQQIKLTELELLDFVDEDLEVALEMMNISELEKNTWNELENSKSRMKLELLRPKTMWEFIGNKDCADELYNSLLCLRLQCEDESVLKDQGINHLNLSESDGFQRNHQLEALNDESCVIFVLISPGNIGSQVCAELAAFGCGYDVKVYKGSDVVEPIVKQWKKGHFFKLFEDSESPPVCTIMTDCSGVIKTGDILKIKNSYYNSLFMKDEGGGIGCHNGKRKKSMKSQKHPTNYNLDSWENPQETRQIVKKQNPGAIIFILEETSETAQFFLSHCNNSNRSFGCSRSYTLCKLDGGSSTGQAIKVLRFNNLTKSAVACKLYTRFKSPTLLSILIGQFGPNIIKASQIMHWIHLIDSLDLSNILSCISLSYTPILFDSILEIPLLMIQKCLLNQEETSMREEIWSFSSFGLIEDQIGIFEVLLKVLHDLVTSIISCLDLKEENSYDHQVLNPEFKQVKTPNYATGFESPQIIMKGYSQNCSCFINAMFLHDLTEMDTKYQIEKFPHLVFHSSGNFSQQLQYQLYQSQNQQQIQHQDHRATCESYFTTLYSIALFNLTSILKQNIPNKTLYSEKVINLVNDKLLKYSPINTGYDKNLTNYYINKKQELSSSWRYMEYLILKQIGNSISKVTWRSVSIDSSIPNLYYKKNVNQAKYHDIVAYIPSRIPKLSVRIPDMFKHN
ncbi:uncharacterized protein cubi_02078 [Cryptosporidium ubiquitum]|uniref:Uncharacterized protein n=1 Tax=Cryptosporidium ubiquitum TaxID=857276 RepID=A0A1J4MRN9_9CRYT|nr:uncharacterized protein cubi_02078 [Cryptosporidium ubiquitum]OII75557.1 hypothetical protein cubi_02078 [Cryptosporidium ubiquitum]